MSITQKKKSLIIAYINNVNIVVFVGATECCSVYGFAFFGYFFLILRCRVLFI